MTKMILLVSRLPQLLWFVSFWLVFLVLLGLTLTPSPIQPLKISHIDKLYHFIAFAAFSFLFCRAYIQVIPIKSLVFCSFVGILIEVVQYYVPNRGFSYADMLADVAGCILGTLLSFQLTKLTVNRSGN
jgi:VanZ family protein